jgi:hypothetical protein
MFYQKPPIVPPATPQVPSGDFILYKKACLLIPQKHLDYSETFQDG